MSNIVRIAPRRPFAHRSRHRISDSFAKDQLVNFTTGLGTAKDPTVMSHFHLNIVDRRALESAYRSDWVARRIVDAPAEDMTREWRAWQAGEDQIGIIEAEEKRLDLQRKTKQALIRARLYGGATLVLGVNQGSPLDPLDFDAIGKGDLKFVVVMNRYELNAGPRIYDVFSPWYTRPQYYSVSTPLYGFDVQGSNAATQSAASAIANPTGEYGDPGFQVTPTTGEVRIHPSRVIEFSGNELPDWRLATMGGGWGDSILQTVDEVLKDFGLTIGGIANMVNDAKVDVVKIPELSKKISTQDYRDKLMSRFAAANIAKSAVNTLILDTQEEWERIQSNFGGLPDVMREFMTLVAGAGNIPVSRLMGQSPGRGLNSTSTGGDTDMRNYYDGRSAYQRTELTPALEPLDQCLVRSALGTFDPNIWFEWNPLYREDPKEAADIALVKAQIAQIDVNMGLINPDVIRAGRINGLQEDGQPYPGVEDAVDEFGAEPEIPEARMWSPGYDPVTGKPLAAPAGGGGFPGAPGGAAGGAGAGGGGNLPGGKTGEPKQIANGGNPKQPKLPAIHVHVNTRDYDPNEPRDPDGKWGSGGGAGGGHSDALHMAAQKFAALASKYKQGIASTIPAKSDKGNLLHTTSLTPPHFYHGTRESLVKSIMTKGLVPHGAPGGDEYASSHGMALADYAMEGGRAQSVYITPDADIAKQFARLTSKEFGSKPVIFQVDIPPEAQKNIKPDEQFNADDNPGPPMAFRYEGKIPPAWITQVPLDTKGMGGTKLTSDDAEVPSRLYFVVLCKEDSARDYNPNHDPKTGQFAAAGSSGGSGGGKGGKGKGGGKRSRKASAAAAAAGVSEGFTPNVAAPVGEDVPEETHEEPNEGKEDYERLKGNIKGAVSFAKSPVASTKTWAKNVSAMQDKWVKAGARAAVATSGKAVVGAAHAAIQDRVEDFLKETFHAALEFGGFKLGVEIGGLAGGVGGAIAGGLVAYMVDKAVDKLGITPEAATHMLSTAGHAALTHLYQLGSAVTGHIGHGLMAVGRKLTGDANGDYNGLITLFENIVHVLDTMTPDELMALANQHGSGT